MKLLALVGNIDCANGASGFIAFAVNWMGVASSLDDITAVM